MFVNGILFCAISTTWYHFRTLIRPQTISSEAEQPPRFAAKYTKHKVILQGNYTRLEKHKKCTAMMTFSRQFTTKIGKIVNRFIKEDVNTSGTFLPSVIASKRRLTVGSIYLKQGRSILNFNAALSIVLSRLVHFTICYVCAWERERVRERERARASKRGYMNRLRARMIVYG